MSAHAQLANDQFVDTMANSAVLSTSPNLHALSQTQTAVRGSTIINVQSQTFENLFNVNSELQCHIFGQY